MTTARVHRFGPFRLDERAAELRRGGAIVALRPKTFALLRYLVSNPGRLIGKDEVLSAVWPDVAVGDAVLKVGVKELRRALEDDAAAPRYLETAHRLGYRFVADVELEGLPARLASFVGREPDRAAIRDRLDRGERLITLVGPGGSGKTRLALEAAHELADSFPDGVHWIELAPIADPDLVPHALAARIGVREHVRRPLTELLIAALRTRRSLLVLDNCEHQVEAAAALAAALLRGCESIRMLATSREPLRIDGESVWPVEPLGLPRDGDADPSGADSFRLFVERAAKIRPGFVPSVEDRPAVARICRRLEGLPLALELAAARSSALSPAEIAAGLDDGLRLLDLGRRDDSRHRTLRATIDWSYDLLRQEERRLLRQLTVFAGSFTLEAATAVAADRALERRSVPDLLCRLVEKSLVVAEGRDRAGASRYRLLELVREYARTKLAAREQSAAFARHAAHFARRAESEAARLVTPLRGDALDALEADLDDFRTVIDRPQAVGSKKRGEHALRVAAALVWFWFHRGYWGEGRRALDRVLRRANVRSASDPRTATALFGAGLLAWTQGDYEVALSRLEASVAVWRKAGGSAGTGLALQFLAVTETSLGRRGAALEHAEEAAAVSRRPPADPFAVASSLASLGIVRLTYADPAGARAALEESVSVSRASGDRWILALPLRNLGILAARRGDLREALALLRESLAIVRELGERWFVSRSIETVASVLARTGESARAARLFGAGEALREEIGAAILPFYQEDFDAGVASLRAAMKPADLAAAWAEGRTLGSAAAIALALEDDS